MFYEIPADGEYELEMRDSIYRGREDFVYRLTVGEQPFVTSLFPLGCRTGHKRYVAVNGWNLSTDRLFLDAESDAAGIRQKSLGRGERSSNEIAYVVDTLRADSETEDNNTTSDAQRITLPRIVNGRIEPAGDVDVFQFRGKAGAEIVAEVVARRVRSPLDSLLRLIDASGRVLAWNDDCEHKDGFLHTDMGVLTHHADSYLRVRLPADGVYYVQLADAQGQGGEAYAYRLRVGPPQPDFALRMTPSSINVRVGGSAPLCVYALRKDGFEGPIEVVLKDAPRGFKLNGARIPAGRECVRMTLTAPPRRLDEPVTLKLAGHAVIDGNTISQPVVPAEDLMQAFLYRHLSPSQELMVAVTGGRGFRQPIELASPSPVRIPIGGAAQVRLKAPKHPRMRDVELELDEPPEGVTLANVGAVSGGLVFELKAAGNGAQLGLADNLIIEAYIEVVDQTKDKRSTQRKQRVSLGALPAIPFEIVRK